MEEQRRRRHRQEVEEERLRRRLAEEDQQRRRRQQDEERAWRRRQQEDAERVQRLRDEEEARRRRRQEEEERWRQRDEAMRHRRYQEQQRRLEEEARRADEEARRLQLRQQADEEAHRQRSQQQAHEEAQQRRKRERSPAAAPASDRPHEAEASSEQHRQLPEGPGSAARAAAEPAQVPDSKKQKRGGLTAAAVSRLDEAGKWQLHEQQQHSKMTNYWFREWCLCVRRPEALASRAHRVALCWLRQHLPCCLTGQFAQPASVLSLPCHTSPMCHQGAPFVASASSFCFSDAANSWPQLQRRVSPRPRAHASPAAAVKLRSYKGVSTHVAQHLLQGVQPPRMALAARQLLHLLRAHEAAAAFQAAARRLVGSHQPQGSAASAAGAAGMPTPEASVLVGECCSALQLLAELLSKPLPTAGGSNSSSGVRAATGTGPPPTLLDAIASRRLLPLLASVLHVPAMHRAGLEAQLGAASAAQAAVVEAAMAQQLGLGAKALLAVLASCRAGRRLLLDQPGVAEALLEATDAGCLAAGWQPAPAAEGAALLQHIVLAEAAVGQLCSAALGSEEFAAAADTATALLREGGPVGRRAVEQALALAAPAVVPRLLLMLRMHCSLLRAAAGTGAAAPGLDPLGVQARQYEPDLQLLLQAAPACAPAAPLLLALLGATHPGVLPAWQQAAVAIQVACSAELCLLAALPEAAAAVVGGLGAARAQLASLKGGVAAVVTAQQARGLTSLLAYLGAELPPLTVTPSEGSGGGPPTGSESTVSWQAVEVLFW